MEALQSLFCACVLKEPMPGASPAAKRGERGATGQCGNEPQSKRLGMQKILRFFFFPLDKAGRGDYYNSYKTYQ